MSAQTVPHINLSPAALKVVEEILSFTNLHQLKPDLDELMNPVPGDVRIVLAGYINDDIPLLELAQTLRSSYAQAMIYLITDKPISSPKKDLLKNGFNDVFYLPIEESFLKDKLGNHLRDSASGTSLLVPVKVTDVLEISKLDINTWLYLPSNNLYVPFNFAGKELDPVKAQKLKDREITNIYIAEEDLPAFYKAYAESIKGVQTSSKYSETKKREILRSISRDLLSDLFTNTTAGMNTSLKVNELCREIVTSYLEGSVEMEKWMEKMKAVAGDANDFFTHSSNSMIACVLMGIGLGIEKKNLEALAIAALLHDIGLSQLPEYLTKKKREEMSPEEWEIYTKHPIHTIETLKEKKVVMPELSQKIILQQHERFDGKGYPKGIKGNQLIQEAQILYLIDDILELTMKKSGEKATTFLEAFDEIKGRFNKDPSACAIHPNLLGDISQLMSGVPVVDPKDKNISSGKWTMSKT